MAETPAANFAALLARHRKAGCPVCHGAVAAVPTASDRAELTCLDPSCTWSASIEGGRVVPLSAALVDQDDELYPDRPGFGGPACDTREHRRRPPCLLCRKISHEGGLCEYHWLDYQHRTRHDNPRPHQHDWAAAQRAAAETSPAVTWRNPAPPPAITPTPATTETTEPMKTPPQPCLCGCGQMIRPDRRRPALLCKKSVYRWRRYRNLKGKLDLDAWLAAGQPSPMTGKAAVPVLSDAPATKAPPPPTARTAATPIVQVVATEVRLSEPIRGLRLQHEAGYVGAYDESGRLLVQLRVA